MRNYQFFYLDASGDVTRNWEFSCENDLVAVVQATALMKTACGVEVWCGARFIEFFEPRSALENFNLMWRKGADGGQLSSARR